MRRDNKRYKTLQNLSSEIERKGSSLWTCAYKRFLKDKMALCSTMLLFIIVVTVIFAPLFCKYHYADLDWSAISQAPNWSNHHIFGTDSLGRDLFVRTMIGGRISLLIGILGAIIASTIGLLYGALAGFIGGRTDLLMMRLVEILSSLPFTFLVILLITFIGRSIFLIFIAIGAVSWLDMARIVRGQAISLKKKEYIQAAHMSGNSTWKIVMKHIIPNTLGIVPIFIALLIPMLILFESFLSFLGLGTQEPMTSWGALINEGAKTMETAPWQLLFPISFLTVTLLCFNYLGEGLRKAFNPKEQQ